MVHTNPKTKEADYYGVLSLFCQLLGPCSSANIQKPPVLPYLLLGPAVLFGSGENAYNMAFLD